jgi:hypothetical protein
MAQRAEKHLSVQQQWKKVTINNFLKKNILFGKGLNQFHYLFTTDKQYIQNI